LSPGKSLLFRILIINNLIYNLVRNSARGWLEFDPAQRLNDGMAKIPVVLVSGFLGAGKTTLVNHILRGEHGLRIAVLVNDFGDINIDSELITNVSGETLALANGCVCCTIRDDLARAIGDITELKPAPDAIIVETSGVSDPAAAAMGLVMSAALAGRVALDLIITVVDAEYAPLLKGEPLTLAREQIQAADFVLLNKADLVDAQALARVRDWIRGAKPDARILETDHCRIPDQVLFGVDERRLHPARDDIPGAGHAHDHGSQFASWSWINREPLALEPLYSLCQQLPTGVFRAKGILHLADVPDRRVLLQVVGRRVQFSKGEPWHGESPATRILFIGVNGDLESGALSSRLETCLARIAPPSANPFAEAVVNILRN
jgi:G3E family GTPase